MKTLKTFFDELQTISFDKKKVQGLVKRANNAGYNIYYAYHEDGESPRRWSEGEYKECDNDVKIFEATELIGKKKPAMSFKKAATYTAECGIFVFCPLVEFMADAELSILKIESVKRKAAKSAIVDYEFSLDYKIAVEKSKQDIINWESLPEDTKAKIFAIDAKINEIKGTYKSAETVKELRKQISDLGGYKPQLKTLADWHIKALSFENVEDYILYKQEIAANNLHAEVERIIKATEEE